MHVRKRTTKRDGSVRADLDIWIRRMRIAFSTLFILPASKPSNCLGCQVARADTTTAKRAGRSLASVPQLLIMAESISTLLDDDKAVINL